MISDLLPKASSGKIEIALSLFGTWVVANSSNITSRKWSSFASDLTAAGFSIVDPAKIKSSGGLMLIVDLIPKTFRELKAFDLEKDKKILICVEPATVNPFQYRLDVQDKFGTVFVPTEAQAVNATNLIWQSGYVFAEDLTQIHPGTLASDRNIEIGIINQNKFSAVKGELYSLRRKAVAELISREKVIITLAGKDWTRGWVWHIFKQLHAASISLKGKKWPNISRMFKLKRSPWLVTTGLVDSELEFSRNSKVALVIENESTYSSEKLINALISGCTIVYVGPPINEKFRTELVHQSRPVANEIVNACFAAVSNPNEPSKILNLALESGIFEEYDVSKANKELIKKLRLLSDD